MTRWYLYPELYDRMKLMELLREGLTVMEIAEHVGCTRTNVESALKNHGIKRPYAGEEVRMRFRK